jgi:hypothetical protein
MPFGAHAAIGQDLRDGVLRGRTLLEFIGAAKRLDIVERMVIADVLQRVGDALDQVFLLDDGLGCWLLSFGDGKFFAGFPERA